MLSSGFWRKTSNSVSVTVDVLVATTGLYTVVAAVVGGSGDAGGGEVIVTVWP